MEIKKKWTCRKKRLKYSKFYIPNNLTIQIHYI